ncbi:MAG: hypothetical protein JWM82_2951, partial [Myxococcales bacterium]|nr:hypothetical protein [Myxococcales bacterium]
MTIDEEHRGGVATAEARTFGDPRQHVTVHDVTPRERSRVEACEQFAAHEV